MNVVKWRLLAAAAMLFLTALLSGCLATVEPIRRDSKLSNEQGAVVFKLIVNAPSSHVTNYMNVVVLIREEPATDNPRVLLERTTSATLGTAIFSGAVAPGRYRMSHATSTSDAGAGQTVYTFPLSSLSSRFDVKAGEVTLLGTLLVQPGEGKRYSTYYLEPESELKQTVESLFPAMAEQARGRSLNSFNTQLMVPAESSVALSFRKNALVTNAPWQSLDGAIYVAGKMGKVRWRSADGKWHDAGVGTWKEVLSLRPYKNGLVAGGEEGLLRYSPDAGKTWRVLAPPDQGLIHTLETFPNGRSLALTKLDSGWQVYVSDDLLSGQWRKIEEISLPKLNSTFAFRLGNRFGVMTAKGTIFLVESQTLSVERIEGSSTIWGAFATPDGLLVKESMGFKRTHSVSADAGKTWNEFQLSSHVDVVALKDSKTVYAWNPERKGGLLFSEEAALLISKDDGVTWTKATKPPGIPFVHRLLVSEIDGSVFAFSDDGRVMRSTDEGASWVQDF